jgi:hypothetical protein
VKRFAGWLLDAFADRFLKSAREYLHCPPEWLDAADDVDVDVLYPVR